MGEPVYTERWNMAMTPIQKARYEEGAAKLGVSVAEFIRMGADGLAEAVLEDQLDPRSIARQRGEQRLASMQEGAD